MKAFWYGTLLQWKMDFRNKEILITYYIVPLVFFLFMGGIFTSIMPDAYKTLIQSMTVFGVTMGAVVGSPAPLVELYGSNIKKAYRVGHIPLWTAAASNFISAFLHLLFMSIILFFTAPVIFGAAVPENVPLYFASLLLMLAANISIGTLLGMFVKSVPRLTMLSQLVFLPSIMLSGIMFPSEMLPKALEFVGKFFPATWGFRLMCSNEPDITAVMVLLAFVIAAAAVSVVRLYKMKSE